MSDGPGGGIFDSVIQFGRLLRTDVELRRRVSDRIFSPVVPEQDPVFPCISYDIVTGDHSSYLPKEDVIVMSRVWHDEDNNHDETREIHNYMQRSINNRNMIVPSTPEDVLAGLGVEQITNGTFDAGTTGWTIAGGATVVAAPSPQGSVLFWSGKFGGSVSQSITLRRGCSYSIGFDLRPALGEISFIYEINDPTRDDEPIWTIPTKMLSKNSTFQRMEANFFIPADGAPMEPVTLDFMFTFGSATSNDAQIDNISIQKSVGMIYHVMNSSSAQDLIDPDTNWRYTQGMWSMSIFTGIDPPVFRQI